MYNRWLTIAEEVVRIIARYNENGIDLDGVFLFVDLERAKVEVTTEPEFSTLEEPFLFGTLSEIDPNRLLTIRDSESEFVIDCVAEMLKDADALAEDTEED